MNPVIDFLIRLNEAPTDAREAALSHLREMAAERAAIQKDLRKIKVYRMSDAEVAALGARTLGINEHAPTIGEKK